MGYLVYDNRTQISFDDRILAHLEVVIISKLRSRDSFPLTWRESPEAVDGRSTIWLDSSIPLRFRFEGSRHPSIDRAWVERLAILASSSTGLVVSDEDGIAAVGTTRERGT